jgi:hypothetical protein
MEEERKIYLSRSTINVSPRRKIQPVSYNPRRDTVLYLSTLLAPEDLANGGRKKNTTRFSNKIKKKKKKIQPVSYNPRRDDVLYLSTLLAPGDLANGGRKKNRFISVHY